MASKSNKIHQGDQVSNFIDENIAEFIAKNFSRVMLRLDKRYGNNVSPDAKDNQQQTPRSGNLQRRGKYGEIKNSSYS